MKNVTVKLRTVLPGLIALLVLFSGALTAPAAADGEQQEIHKRVVKVHRHCAEGDEGCQGERVERRVIIRDGEGGPAHHGAHVWVDDGGHAFAFHGGKSGFLGVELTELTPELRGHFGVPEEAGVMVGKLMPDSPAARAGLAVGDIVAEVDGEAVASAGALARAIGSHKSGETVTLGVWREGQRETLSATLEEREMAHRVAVDIDCEEGDEDCGHAFVFAGGEGFDCGGAEECEVRVECRGGGDCDCTLNGEAADCEALHLGHGE